MRHTNLPNEITGSYHNTNNTWLYIIIGLMILAAGAIYYFTFVDVEPNPGCIASAYQATKNGGDLEANLAACN